MGPTLLILPVLAFVALMAYAAYDADGPWGPLMALEDLIMIHRTSPFDEAVPSRRM